MDSLLINLNVIRQDAADEVRSERTHRSAFTKFRFLNARPAGYILHRNREKQMKAFLLACAAAIVVAVVGAAALNTI